MEDTQSLLERLRARAWRMTPQRRAVTQVIDGAHTHMTAEDIHHRARVIIPEISLATVYNALNELVRLGELREVRARSGAVRYDPNVSPHHHLVCTQCGRTYDVRPRGLTGLRLENDDIHGFRVDDVDVVFRGTCPACRRAE